MKRCPQCYAIYQGTGIFCENDGRRLLDVPGIVAGEDELVPDAPSKRSNSTSVMTGFAGVLIGVVLCGGAYVAYSFLKPETETSERTRSPLEAQLRETSQPRPAPARSVEAEPTPDESSTPEEEPETDASPEPAPPADTVATARLNGGPVSTGGPQSANSESAKVKTIIEMHDGSIVEVDAAWKDGQGVWYRRGGLVSFVEGPRVKSITARAEPKASAAVSQ
jgi:cytoskeletal protein RodZ